MLTLLVSLLLASSFGVAPHREQIIGLPCEGCEAVFEDMPAVIPDRGRLAPTSEPGAPMIVTGCVFDRSGSPASGIIIYAYQTNAAGIYPTTAANRGSSSHRHGMLRSWAKADKQGRYAFDTIRPADYPATDLPEHIQLHVMEPACSTYYIDDTMFEDDSRLSREQINKLTLNRGRLVFRAPLCLGGFGTCAGTFSLAKNLLGA